MPRKDGHAWIVAVDDAENVGGGLPDALRSLGARTDVHLVLAAREADWALRALADSMWQSVGFRRVPLAGLDEEDASHIAAGWAAWGDAAMGKLRGQTAERATKALLDNARELAAKREEGALLGALLIVREGEDLRERVIRLMRPWEGAPGICSRSLLDIYAMIAAMHAENQLYLSRTILAYALSCGENDLDRGPLRVLRREAMVDSGTTYILTRHRRIAEVARDWLLETGYDVDQWYPFLAGAARSEFKRNRRSTNPDLNRWTVDLARYFVDRGPARWPVARAVAQALLAADRDDPQRVTHYANTLRRTGQPGEALALMHEHAPRFRSRRNFLYEWSVAAGAVGDYGSNVWLAARSLADHATMPPNSKDCKLSRAGLGAAFREIAASTGQRKFAAAQAACGRLGLRLAEIDQTTRKYFEEYTAATPSAAGAPASIESDIQTLARLVVDASYETEPENGQGLDALIDEADSYGYKMLIATLSAESNARGKS